MKIKLLKDIPGYKTGDIIQEDENYSIPVQGSDKDSYKTSGLVDEGFAEWVKDDIDIEKIRNEMDNWEVETSLQNHEIRWFTAYRIVKTVIEKLNGDWKYTKDSHNNHWIIGWDLDIEMLLVEKDYHRIFTIIPIIKEKEIGEKVITLCEPELKVLFGVK